MRRGEVKPFLQFFTFACLFGRVLRSSSPFRRVEVISPGGRVHIKKRTLVPSFSRLSHLLSSLVGPFFSLVAPSFSLIAPFSRLSRLLFSRLSRLLLPDYRSCALYVVESRRTHARAFFFLAYRYCALLLRGMWGGSFELQSSTIGEEAVWRV